ncbi:MAG: hypothetical protein IJL72_06700 [Lachnospiraceae bacterium]|nr:hypothetical protein [Lachnospiraceae bacterium]
MKKTLRRAGGILLFVLLLALSVRAAARFLDKTDVDEKYKQFFASDTNFDVIVMGTSHAYNTILPQELWRGYGIASYNWGQGNCTLPEDYYILQLLSRYTDPKLVVIDLFGFVEFSEVGNGKYRPDARDLQRVQFDPFPLSRLKIEAVRDLFDDYDKRYDFLFPFAMYHSRWSEIKKDNFCPRDIPQKGAAFVLGFYDATGYVKPESAEAHTLTTVNVGYLDKLIAYCRDNGIELLFTYVPFLADQANADAAATMEALLREKYGLALLNMLETDLFDPRTDVHDPSHLNYIGAVDVTDFLGAYIAAQYPDLVRRGDPAYASWDADYDHYIDYKISRFEPGKLYNNLALLYGSDFRAELLLSEGYDVGADRLFADLIDRLGSRITVRVSGTDPASGFILEVTDRRTGEIVFRDAAG